MRRRLIALLACLVLAPMAASAAPALAPQSSSAGGVTVKATPRNLSAAVWEFELAFDTHSQDLNDDPARSASLHAAGTSVFSPLGWKGDPPGGHHRKGVLRFKPITPTPAALELRLQRAGEAAPRVFRWQLK